MYFVFFSVVRFSLLCVPLLYYADYKCLHNHITQRSFPICIPLISKNVHQPLVSCSYVQATRQKKLLKSRRKPEKSEGKALPHLYGSWSPSGNPSRQFENQLAPSMRQSPPSSMLSHQRQFPGPEYLQYQHMTNLFVAPSAYGNLTNPYPAMPVLSHVQSAERKHQPLLPGYEGSPRGANPISKSVNTCVKPLIMTPQEKIEKLRRRQQMQAMLAIQKQQQQFNHQVPSVNHSITQKSTQESQTLHFEGADLEVEDISNFPALDPNSPLEQDDSNTVSVAVDDYSVEETVLFRLQDVISKVGLTFVWISFLIK